MNNETNNHALAATESQHGYGTSSYTKVKTYGKNRRCKECNTPLTVYNESKYCFRHRYKEIEERDTDRLY